jgi:hypothetical protein
VASRKGARGRQRAARSVKPVVPAPPALIDLGRTAPVTVTRGTDQQIKLSLSDGTTLKMKPLIISIDRSLGKYNALGEPIYQIQAGFVMQLTVPKKFKRKVKA